MPLQMRVFSLLNIFLKKTKRRGPRRLVGLMQPPWATAAAWPLPGAMRLLQPPWATTLAYRRGLRRLDVQPLWRTTLDGQIR
jgi:hypothetical protein